VEHRWDAVARFLALVHGMLRSRCNLRTLRAPLFDGTFPGMRTSITFSCEGRTISIHPPVPADQILLVLVVRWRDFESAFTSNTPSPKSTRCSESAPPFRRVEPRFD
jgi:hypothetical protein